MGDARLCVWNECILHREVLYEGAMIMIVGEGNGEGFYFYQVSGNCDLFLSF